MATVVVGVDGSEGSNKALRFAFDEARARNADVKAVSVWQIPAGAFETGWLRAPVDFDEFSKSAHATLDKALDDVGAATAGIEVARVVLPGQAADVLCTEAKGADLLVVGSRGVGGLQRMLLGSVSQQCAHHTPCPLVIVPSGTPD